LLSTAVSAVNRATLTAHRLTSSGPSTPAAAAIVPSIRPVTSQWTAKATDILEKTKRARKALNNG
jgi:hypothetical protein